MKVFSQAIAIDKNQNSVKELFKDVVQYISTEEGASRIIDTVVFRRAHEYEPQSNIDVYVQDESDNVRTEEMVVTGEIERDALQDLLDKYGAWLSEQSDGFMLLQCLFDSYPVKDGIAARATIFFSQYNQ